MSGRGYDDPERVAETSDLAGQATTTSRVANYRPRLMHENRHVRAMGRAVGGADVYIGCGHRV